MGTQRGWHAVVGSWEMEIRTQTKPMQVYHIVLRVRARAARRRKLHEAGVNAIKNVALFPWTRAEACRCRGVPVRRCAIGCREIVLC